MARDVTVPGPPQTRDGPMPLLLSLPHPLPPAAVAGPLREQSLRCYTHADATEQGQRRHLAEDKFANWESGAGLGSKKAAEPGCLRNGSPQFGSRVRRPSTGSGEEVPPEAEAKSVASA